MHRSQHASDKPVDTPTLFHQGNKRAYPTFIVGRVTEIREDQPLERIYLVLQAHQVRNSLVTETLSTRLTRITNQVEIPFVRVVDPFQRDVFLIFK